MVLRRRTCLFLTLLWTGCSAAATATTELSGEALTVSLMQTLRGSDTARTSALFATSMAADGNLAVIGTPWMRGATADSAGAAYLFSRATGSWSQLQKLELPDGVSSDDFGEAVAIAGDTVVVGNPTASSSAGAVHVFARAEGDWIQQAKLTAPAPSASSRFGCSVAIAGDRILVGARDESQRGAAYVFRLQDAAWVLEATLVAAPTRPFFIGFGHAVALSDQGDRAVVTAPSVGQTNSPGLAYEFVRDGTSWSLRATVTSPDGNVQDQVGVSVDLDGDTLLLGAPGEDDSPSNPPLYGTGAAYIFRRTATGWTSEAKLLPPPGANGVQTHPCCSEPVNFMLFGNAVQLAGERAYVGAPYENSGVERSGATYVFERSAGTWSQVLRIPPPVVIQTGSFGHSLAVVPGGLLVGSPGTSNSGFFAAGSAYSFSFDDDDNDGVLNPGDNCRAVPNPGQADNDGDGVGDACDEDDDNDGLSDLTDNCPFTANSAQADQDDDGRGDACDTDRDGDAVNNEGDSCPLQANPGQSDNDGDGLGDACDDDDDDDGVLDGPDNCDFAPNASQQDRDGDGQGDVCDGDLDGDGISQPPDNCPLQANVGQEDRDGDGQGDACDHDDDGDGVVDPSDACPLTPATSRDANADGCVDALSDLVNFIRSLGLPKGIENSLISKAESAAKAKTRDRAAQMLDVLIQETLALQGKQIPSAQAAQLIAFVENVKAAL